MNTLTFIILSAAVWRVTHILFQEKGPFEIFEKMRNLMVNLEWNPTFCFKCTSVWVALILTAFLGLTLPMYILTAFAASGMAILIRLIIEQEEI